MECIRPFKPFGKPHTPCSTCLPCKRNRRRELYTKLTLEYNYWKNGAFVTLTYRNANLPLHHLYPNRGTLDKIDTSKFLDRLRKNIKYTHGEHHKIRYYQNGEYGKKGRAHYHFMIFTSLPLEQLEEMILKSWQLGDINEVSPIVPERMQYILKHAVKNTIDIPHYEDEQIPEYATMSKNPALGALSLDPIAEMLKKKNIYPSSGLTNLEKWYLEQSEIKPSLWTGGFWKIKDKETNQTSYVFPTTDKPLPSRPKGEYLKLDKHLMKLLAKKVNPELTEHLNKLNDMLPPDEYQSYLNRIEHEHFNSNIQFQTSADIHNAEKQHDKAVRDIKRNKRNTKCLKLPLIKCTICI